MLQKAKEKEVLEKQRSIEVRIQQHNERTQVNSNKLEEDLAKATYRAPRTGVGYPAPYKKQ